MKNFILGLMIGWSVRPIGVEIIRSITRQLEAENAKRREQSPTGS